MFIDDQVQSTLENTVQSQNSKVTKKCSQNNVSQMVCSNKNCKAYAFTCKNSSCKCRKQHELCFMTETSSILRNFSSKMISYKTLQTFVDEEFDKIINKLSDFRDKILQDIAQLYKLYGLNEDQKKVYESIMLEKTDEISGIDIWSACYNQPQLNGFSFDRMILEISDNFLNHQDTTQIFLQSIQQHIQSQSFYVKKLEQQRPIKVNSHKQLKQKRQMDEYYKKIGCQYGKVR